MKVFKTPNQTPGEFFDRLTIVMRKSKRLPKEDNRSMYRKKLQQMINIIPDDIDKSIVGCVVDLMMVNTDIWQLESDLRQGKEGKLGEAEVGRRAIHIREINADRIRLVNEINELYGITEKEVKADHASQEDN